MKSLVEDRLDDIGAAVTNSDKEIEMDLIKKNQKKAYIETLKKDNTDRDLEHNAVDIYILIY